MSAFSLLFGCLALGVLLARVGRLPANMPEALNAWVLKIALPALVLVQIPRLQLSTALLFPALAPWGVLAGAALLFALIGRARGWSRATIGALTLTCGLGNTAFMGIAMTESLLGPAAVGPAVIADQLGSFLALSSAGVALAAAYSGSHTSTMTILRRIVLFPSFIALVIAFAVRAAGGWPQMLELALQRVADTLMPLALFSVGLQLKLSRLTAHADSLIIGLSWKLAVAPLLIALTGAALGVRSIAYEAGVLQSAMAPMITAGILAQEHDLDPPLAARVVGVGILLSLLTVPLAAWLLR